MNVAQLAVELLALVIYGNAIVILHEAGHAALAHPAGLRVTSFGVGFGPPVARIKLAGSRVVYLARWPVGGACTAVPRGPDTRRRWIFHAGGLLAQLVLGLVLALLPPSWLAERIAAFNLLVALTNALPWRVGQVASDGWYLLDSMRRRPRTGEVITQRRQLCRLAERENALGSLAGSTYAEIVLAWVDIQRGRPDLAADLLERDPAHTALEAWFDVLYAVVSAECFRAAGRPLDAIRTLRRTRTAREPELSATAQDLLAIIEGRTLLDLDAPGQALQRLSTVLGVSGPAGRQATVLLVRALLDAKTEDLVAATLRAVRAARGALLDPIDAAGSLDLAATTLEDHGALETARSAREASASVVRRVLDRLDDAEERAVLERLLAARVRTPGDTAAILHRPGP